jgi:hypothetical protein
MSGRGILNLVKVANGALEHVRKDFIALRGDSHSWFLCFQALYRLSHEFGSLGGR